MDPGRDADTAALLAAQLGVASRRQFRTLGWSADQIDGEVARGGLQVVQRGVYRVPGGGVPSGQAAMAAVLRLGPGSRISGEGVLAHHRFAEVAAGTVGCVLVAPPRRPRAAPIAWRWDHLPTQDGADLGPIPGTTVARALVEVAGAWSSRRWLSAFDAARWRRLASTDEVLAVVSRLPRRHPGVRWLGRLRETGALQQESHGERDLAAALAAIGFVATELVWQAQVSPQHRVDVLLPDSGLVIEYDGADFHSDGRDRAKDANRDRELAALGHHVLRLRAEDLRDRERLRARIDESRSIARHLRAAIHASAPQPPAAS